MNIVFASDHAGFELKGALLAYVRDELKKEVFDCGAYILDPEDDYTTFINAASQMVSKDPINIRAIIIGGSGQGEAMHANRKEGVRAAVYYGGPLDIITLSREHNNANVLSLGARFIDLETAKGAVDLWFQTQFSNDEKYERRIKKMN